MKVKSKRLFVSFCLALVMAVSFVLGACLAWLPRAVRAEGERYKLDFSAEDFSAWKIDGISYDVSFDFSTAGKTNGWFANSVPTLEDITMSWTGVEESVTARDIGEIYGIARSVTGENADFLFYAGESDAMGFVYNGGADTFTKQGTATTVAYTKALAAENKITVTGSEMTFNAYVGTYAAADAAGAQYLGVQWTGTEKPYSASLTDVKIYNAGGLDLGVQISANATSSSVQRYGNAGEEITVYPVQKTGQEFVGLTATPADGEAYALDVTDNYDGSYSFVMPQEDVAVSAVYTNRYALTLGDGVQTTSITGVSYDVDFDFKDGSGWFANSLPSSESITMRWLGVSQERTGSANPGEVYGIVRSVNDDNPHMIQMAPSSGFRFTFNATTNTYTNPGESTILSYSKALVAGGTESLYYNGSPNRYTFHQLGGYGTFATADAQKQDQMIQCNIAALTALTHFYLQEMLQRNKGWILNVSSVAAFEPGPLMSVYYATKAFVLSFTEALSVELEGTGVHISALCPGPTRTGFARAAHLGRSGLFSNLPVADATDVAHYGVSQLFAGKVIAVPGWSNKLAIQVVKFLPRSLTRHLVYWIQK